MGSWIMTQTWEDLCFCHWEVDEEKLNQVIPHRLELDLFAGKAWLTVLSFRVNHQRFRWLPEIPFMRRYLELNVRTYVKAGGVPGVYFFSLDVDNWPAAIGTKAASLPYRLAKMEMQVEQKIIRFRSKRVINSGGFSSIFQRETKLMEPGNLDQWLLERYRMFSVIGGLLIQGEIWHEPWEVCSGTAKILDNSVTPFLVANEPDAVHYADSKHAYILRFRL